MTYEGINCIGDTRIQYLQKHQQFYFVQSATPFSAEIEVFNEQISDIYRVCFDNGFDKLWQNYINCFTIDEIIHTIKHLDTIKDAGPMDISVNFVQYNIEIIAPQ